MKPSFIVMDGASSISIPIKTNTAIDHALDMVVRDYQKVVGERPLFIENEKEADLVVRYSLKSGDCPQRPEAFGFRFSEKNGKLQFHIVGFDDLGIVYGLLYYSQHYLGVDPLWFWADLPIERKPQVNIPVLDYDSPERMVRYRGWFINDEVCLIGWKDVYPPTKEVWYPVFEALLRCGGNMVIPGTDLPKYGIHADLASEMGLWVTHHHAEPLGAEMFLRSFPDKIPSYKQNPQLFEQLWQEAIEKQKSRNTVWVLSFRGQGDAPFWEHDPEFDTPEKRGEMISKVVERQYEMVREAVANPVCCMALYGEISELYKAGWVKVPDGVIKVWADNGYGKMVSRRQGNENRRVPALPSTNGNDEHGMYYHITFHDLQASNHLTMFPNPPDLLKEEIEKAYEAGAVSYLLVNSGNIRPHLYPLDMIRELWSIGTINIEEHLQSFIQRSFQSKHEEIGRLFTDYFIHTIQYGPNRDDKAGEEFYHHNARRIIRHWLQGRSEQPLDKLFWATGERDFPEQVRWFKEKCQSGLEGWEAARNQCREQWLSLPDGDRQRFYDHLLLPVEQHFFGCKGFILMCQAFQTYQDQHFPLAFVQVSKSIEMYNECKNALKRAEHGKWKNFYRADWLTNIDSTLYSLGALLKFIRMQEDSPHFFLWYKEYLMPETEKNIYLENTHRKPLSDTELAQLLADKFRAEGDLDW